MPSWRKMGACPSASFKLARPLDLVQGDGRDGIWLDTKDGKRKTYLFVWIDDYSRKLLSGRYFFDEKLPRMEDTFSHGAAMGHTT